MFAFLFVCINVKECLFRVALLFLKNVLNVGRLPKHTVLKVNDKLHHKPNIKHHQYCALAFPLYVASISHILKTIF